MVAALSFWDHAGERQHSRYLAAPPESGKPAFLQRLEREILRAKQHFPAALHLGIADGAASHWRFLKPHTERQLIDFFHASESLAQLAQAASPQRQAKGQRARWQRAHASTLKHDPNTLDGLIEEAARLSQRRTRSQTLRAGALSAWTNFTNQRHQMNSPSFLAAGLPIGSGVTEAACKTLVKQRLCASGDALEAPRRRHRAQPARANPNHRTLRAVLAEDRPIRGRMLRLSHILRRPYPED